MFIDFLRSEVSAWARSLSLRETTAINAVWTLYPMAGYLSNIPRMLSASMVTRLAGSKAVAERVYSYGSTRAD